MKFARAPWIYLVLIPCLFVFEACLARKERPLAPTLIAMVNGTSVKEHQLRYRIQLETAAFGEEVLEDEPRIQKIKQSTLDRIIQNLIILEWGKRNGILLGEEERAKGLNQLKRGYTDKDFEAYLETKNVPYSEWSEIAYETLHVQKILSEEIYAKTAISAQEITNYYHQHLEEFRIQERVRARHIVTDTPEKADLIHARLMNGENFAKLAVLHSISPDRSKGGDLGYFERGKRPAIFDEICFGLQIGQLSPVVKSDYGYHIFKVIDRAPAGHKSLTEVSTLIKERLFDSKTEATFKRWYEPIKASAQIFVNEEALEKLML